ncbi:MAG: hypothetical protein PHF86_08755 [Candidatus Nanoarchaeia archaeon]|nr:hypothetical protein [Candidatus Nanoarchaeia archaeon]
MRYGSESVTLEFLIKTLAKNLQYIFLVLATLNLLNILNFNLNPQHFPNLSINSEISKIIDYTYNPIFIYGHYLYIFFLIIKGFATSFIETIQTNWISAMIISLLIVNIWFLYSKMSNKKNVLSELTKNVWSESNILERGLWVIFFLDIITIITTPGELEIIALIIVYLLILSIKFIPYLSDFIITTTEKLENTFLYNKNVMLTITGLDILLIYFDSSSIFTLFLIILLYNGIAYLVLKFLKEYRKLYDYMFYIFNFGMLVFFFSLVLIYWIAFAVVSVIQSPIIGIYYYKYKKFLSKNIIEIVNGLILIVLLYLYFI